MNFLGRTVTSLSNIGWSYERDDKRGIKVAIDLSQYIKAGYAPICHCIRTEAVLYISQQLEMKAQFAKDDCAIEVEIAPDCWAPSGYYWEKDTLFKKGE